jgi:hypothetical protein
VCCKLCSSCWSLYLLREKKLSAPIHSPLSSSPFRSFTLLPRSLRSTLVFWLNQETVHETMQPSLDPAGHQVPRTKPTCLLHTWRPHQKRPFALVLHLLQHQSSRNLHLQYLAQNQSTQHCQSLITPGSDHHRSSNHTWSSIVPLMSALTTHTYSNLREKEKKRN